MSKKKTKTTESILRKIQRKQSKARKLSSYNQDFNRYDNDDDVIDNYPLV